MPPIRPSGPVASSSVPAKVRRTWRQRLVLGVGFLTTVGALAVAAEASWLNRSLASVARVDVAALAPSARGPENFLIVGSDSRASAARTDPDFGSMGNESETGGQRSDTIMLVRLDPAGRHATVLSLPRDLYVPIAGTKRTDRINAAFAKSPTTLIETVQNAFDVPVHHYVQVDFGGFKRIVDAIGGVEICFDAPARDANTGLVIGAPGCYTLGGVQALAYARSRHFQTRENGRWREDPSGDLGRIERQQDFLRRTLSQAESKVRSNPLALNSLVSAGARNVVVDQGLSGDDLVGLARAFRGLAPEQLETYTLPASPKTVGSMAVLIPSIEEAEPLLARFR